LSLSIANPPFGYGFLSIPLYQIMEDFAFLKQICCVNFTFIYIVFQWSLPVPLSRLSLTHILKILLLLNI